MGVVIQGASNVRVVDNVFDDIGYAVIGLEPNSSYQGGRDIVIRNNTIGSYSLNNWLKGFLFYACDATWSDGPSTTRGVTITGNRVAGNPNGKDGGMMGLNILVCNESPHIDFTITNNTAGKAVAGPVMRLWGMQNVTVTGNTQPLSSGKLANFDGSTGVTFRN